MSGARWLRTAAELLLEPDPGPTPWLVENLIVDQSLCAMVGRWKTGKTWLGLELALSVVTGLPVLESRAVPRAGPAILVLEESGAAALHRRLRAMCQAKGLHPDALNDLHYAANLRVRLDDETWLERLIEAGRELRPRLMIFDPLARMKAPGRNENAQAEMATLWNAWRLLRDESRASVLFVHHMGHHGTQGRGTSDLETVWESRLEVERNGDVISVKPEHREAEPSPTLRYRIANENGALRLAPEDTVPAEQERRQRVIAVLRRRGPDDPASQTQLEAEVGGNREEVRGAVRSLIEDGTVTVTAGRRRARLHRLADYGNDDPAPPRPTPPGAQLVSADGTTPPTAPDPLEGRARGAVVIAPTPACTTSDETALANEAAVLSDFAECFAGATPVTLTEDGWRTPVRGPYGRVDVRDVPDEIDDAAVLEGGGALEPEQSRSRTRRRRKPPQAESLFDDELGDAAREGTRP